MKKDTEWPLLFTMLFIGQVPLPLVSLRLWQLDIISFDTACYTWIGCYGLILLWFISLLWAGTISDSTRKKIAKGGVIFIYTCIAAMIITVLILWLIPYFW